MNTNTTLLASVGALFVASGATADFVDVSARLVESGGMETWRIYANFDSPTDSVLGVGAIPGVGGLNFSSSAPLFNDGGPFEGLQSGDFPSPGIGNINDSWVTIGKDDLTSDVSYSPDFLGVPTAMQAIEGSAWSDDNGGWFDSDPGTAEEAGAAGEVLLAQFSFDTGTTWSLEGVVSWKTPDTPSGEFNTDAFTVVIPGPGAFALLGLAGVAGFRRRRA